MAVIREKRQYLSQPIGVVRAQVGNKETWRNLSQFADTLIEGSYKALVDEAQQKGQELGMSATSNQLRTIDPETGKPEAFAIPPQFGRVAAKHYQSVVERRYVSEVEAELKEESARVYAEEALKPNGYALYSQRMRKYAEDMTENALPRFQNIVSGMSSSLIAGTELKFVQRDQQRNLEAQSMGLQEDAQTGASNIAGVVGAIDFSNPDSVAEIEGLFAGNMQAQRDGLNGYVLDATTYSKQENVLVGGVSLGIKANINRIYLESRNDAERGPLSPEDIKQAELVILAGGTGIESVDERLRPIVEFAKSFKVNVTDSRMGSDGQVEEFTVERNFTSALGAAIAQDLTSLHRDAVSIRANQEATETDAQKNDRYSWELKLFKSGPEGGINETISRIREFIDMGSVDGAITQMNRELARIEKEAKQFDLTPVARDTLNNALQQVRKGVLRDLTDRLYQQVVPVTDDEGNTTFRAITARESQAINDFLSGSQSGASINDVPESLRPIVTAIKEQNTDDVDLQYGRYISTKHTDVVARDTAAKKASEAANEFIDVLNGVGENTKKNRENFDKVYSVPDTPNFFITDEGLQLLSAGGEQSLARKYITAGFVGENLRKTAVAVAEGTGFFDEGAVGRFFVMYDSLRTEANTMGVTVTPWDRSLSAKQVATLDTINYAIKNLRGSQNAGEVYTRIQEFMVDEDRMKTRMRAVTGSLTGETFVADAVGSENLAAIDYLVPLMPYYVAGGLGPEEITDLLKNTVERQFPSTEGYIVDPVGGDGIFKSQHSLAKYFPSQGDRISIVRNINAHLQAKGIDAFIPRVESSLIEKLGFGVDTLFGGKGSIENMNILDMAALGIDEDATPVFLMPITGMSTGETDEGNIVYQLVTMTQTESGADLGFDMYKHNGVPVYFSIAQMRSSISPLPPEKPAFDNDAFLGAIGTMGIGAN